MLAMTPLPLEPSPPAAATGTGFATTRWTMVLSASDGEGKDGRLALEELCRSYWRPLYAFVRRSGHNPHDAQDLTQAFFAGLLSGPSLGYANPARGRFRSFLLASVKHFLANEWDKARTLKRGGAVQWVALDTEAGEAAWLMAPAPGLTPDLAYDRQWALALLDRVIHDLREEYTAAGRASWFEQLRWSWSSSKAPTWRVSCGRAD